MKNIFCLILILIAFSCKKNENSKNSNQDLIETKNKEDDQFKVIIEAVVKEDDKFQLFYVDNSPDGIFSPEKRVVFNLKGGDTPQKIQFTLPEKVLPYKFRIDLGENNIETIVEIYDIKLQYNNRKILIDSLVLERFFQPNIYLEKLNNGYKRKVVDGRCDPFLVSTPLLNKKMELEL